MSDLDTLIQEAVACQRRANAASAQALALYRRARTELRNVSEALAQERAANKAHGDRLRAALAGKDSVDRERKRAQDDRAAALKEASAVRAERDRLAAQVDDLQARLTAAQKAETAGRAATDRLGGLQRHAANLEQQLAAQRSAADQALADLRAQLAAAERRALAAEMKAEAEAATDG